MVGSLVHHVAHGRGIIVKVEPAVGGSFSFYHVRWDEPIEWDGVAQGNFCWVNDDDVQIVSETPRDKDRSV